MLVSDILTVEEIQKIGQGLFDVLSEAEFTNKLTHLSKSTGGSGVVDVNKLTYFLLDFMLSGKINIDKMRQFSEYYNRCSEASNNQETRH